MPHYNTLEYRNWISFAHGLINVLCDGLRPFLTRETVTFYNNVSVAAGTGPPCTCTFVKKRKSNQYHDMSTCTWANILRGHHHRNEPNWKQSDSTKWTDPIQGPWEIAKLFIPDVGGRVIMSAEDMDLTGILNLLYWCDHFRPIPQAFIKDLRDIRNIKCGHMTKLELTNAEKATAFGAMEALLQDPKLAHDRDAQNALHEIQILKTVTDVNNFQAKILTQYKTMIDEYILDLQTDSTQNLTDIKQLQQQLNIVKEELQRIKDTLETKDNVYSYMNQVKSGTLLICSSLIKYTRVMSKRLLTPWLMIILLCNFSVTLLDPRSYQDGCPAEDAYASVLFETKELNMSEYLDTDRAEDFVGRQWLFRELEDAFEEENIAGVQIIGSPGSGKSSLASQLICSRTSSSFIHGRILGYHFCKYSDKNTQMAGKFVRNLAEMIGRRLPEYGYIVTNTTYIQRSLKEDCSHYQDPVGCFELAVLSPLRNLKDKPREKWFVVVDALDECLTQVETGHSIVYLLSNKIHRFPPWLKVVMTSRNESDASLHSSKVEKITIDPEDSRNLKDLEIYVTKRLFQESSLLNRVTAWFGDDSVKSIAKLAGDVLNISQGNFLFVKELLDYWELSRPDLSNAFVLPKTLGDLYQSYFNRLYPRKGSFKYARNIFELLVSTFEPLTQKQILELLKMRENNLDEEYDFKTRLKELGHFLKYGKDNTVTLYHLSLTEWLTSEENEKYFVSKEKGHEVFCDYYFGVVRDRKKNRAKDHILTLVQHIVRGGSKEAYVQEFLSLPSQMINSSDPQNSRTLLHSAATIDNRDILELIFRHFMCIDCVDDRGITPAFLAAERGFVDNLALLVKKGAKINHKAKSMVAFYKANLLRNVDTRVVNSSYNCMIFGLIKESTSQHFDSTMLHAAAQSGSASVVHFLIEKNASLSMLNGVQLTAIQIAAEKGHLEVVKTLYEAGAVADQTALHHAAANNRLEVVNYLLDTAGVKDECLRCDGSFYWVKGTNRLPGSSLSILIKRVCLLVNVRANSCFLSDNTWLFENKTLFDDEHLIFCHSALHAAVASGHDKVVTRLLSEKHNALDCHDYSGRTPLHEAVQKNNTIIVNLLLKKQSQIIHRTCKHWQKLHLLDLYERIEYYKEVCHCGYTPLHVAARYGHHQLATLLIRKGARVDDQDCSGATPLHIAALHGLADTVNVLLQMNAMTIECGKPFNDSLFHLLSYSSPTFEENNFFFSENCSETTDPLFTVKKGPVAKAVESHPEKQLVTSSCFDAEGFTALHRAAQGANLVAIRYLLANGANDSILDPQGYDALTLAVLHAGRKRLWEVHGCVWGDEDIGHLIQAEQAAIELLRHAVKTRGYKIRCDSTKAELTLYHLAASRGLVNFIKVIFNETDLDQLDVDCANLDGITPLYLADLFQQVVTFDLDNPWKELIRFLKQRGGKTRDPTKDAEHSIIFNTVFGFFPNKFTLDLRPDVVHFVTSLLTSYEKSENESFRCSFVPDLNHKNYYHYFPVLRLRRNIDEFLRGLPEDDRSKHFWRDFTRCSYHMDEFNRYLLSFNLHKEAYRKYVTKNKNSEVLSKVQTKWFQKQLLILMKIRHTEVFRAFACLKSLSSRLKSVFHFDARPVASIVREYEKCPPVSIYLSLICGSLTLIFEDYKNISSQLPMPEGQKELFSRLGCTILELILKRSLGFFRKYDHLKTLQFGITPGTQVDHIFTMLLKYTRNMSFELKTFRTRLRIGVRMTEKKTVSFPFYARRYSYSANFDRTKSTWHEIMIPPASKVISVNDWSSLCFN